MSSVEENFFQIKNRIAEAERRAGRELGSTCLIAVTKTKSPDMIGTALRAGIRDFGENYVQEATKKMERIRFLFSENSISWHLIGSLQTNKSKYVVGKFETIQSVDRFELANALDKRAAEAGVIQNILVQVKLGDEPLKGGVLPEDGAVLIEKIMSLHNLRLEGLMSMPPLEAEPENGRKYFSQLRQIRDSWKDLVDHSRGSFKHLSMGTSHDFEVAIEEGATMVRIGTAIFGNRETKNVISIGSNA